MDCPDIRCTYLFPCRNDRRTCGDHTFQPAYHYISYRNASHLSSRYVSRSLLLHISRNVYPKTSRHVLLFFLAASLSRAFFQLLWNNVPWNPGQPFPLLPDHPEHGTDLSSSSFERLQKTCNFPETHRLVHWITKKLHHKFFSFVKFSVFTQFFSFLMPV